MVKADKAPEGGRCHSRTPDVGSPAAASSPRCPLTQPGRRPSLRLQASLSTPSHAHGGGSAPALLTGSLCRLLPRSQIRYMQVSTACVVCLLLCRRPRASAPVPFYPALGGLWSPYEGGLWPFPRTAESDSPWDEQACHRGGEPWGLRPTPAPGACAWAALQSYSPRPWACLRGAWCRGVCEPERPVTWPGSVSPEATTSLRTVMPPSPHGPFPSPCGHGLWVSPAPSHMPPGGGGQAVPRSRAPSDPWLEARGYSEAQPYEELVTSLRR